MGKPTPFARWTLLLAALSCKPAPDHASTAQSTESKPAPCKSNNGRGYGVLYQCGQNWCAKDNAATYDEECLVDVSKAQLFEESSL